MKLSGESLYIMLLLVFLWNLNSSDYYLLKVPRENPFSLTGKIIAVATRKVKGLSLLHFLFSKSFEAEDG